MPVLQVSLFFQNSLALQQGTRVNQVFVQRGGFFRQAQSQRHQLREVEHRHLLFQFHLELAAIQVGMAKRTSHHERIRSGFAGARDQVTAQVADDVRARERMGRATTGSLVRPVIDLRPPQVTGASHPENPTEMDALMNALGVEVNDWSYKTSCCGATHSLTRPDIVRDLSSNLIARARESGADALVVACPLCHTNLDGRQFQMKLKETMPVFYFTQLMALALGLPEKAAALNKNLVDPRPLLQSKGILER